MDWPDVEMSGTIRLWMSGSAGQIVARLIHEARHYHQEWHIRLFESRQGGAHPNAGEWHRNSRDYKNPPEDGAVMSDSVRSEAMRAYLEQSIEADAETFTRRVMAWLSGMNL